MNTSISSVKSKMNRKPRTVNSKLLNQLVTKSQVRNMINSLKKQGELKYKDVNLPIFSVTSTGQIFVLSAVSAGSGVNQRIGDELTINSLEGRIFFTLTSTLTLCNFRLVIFQWIPNTVPLMGDIFETPLSPLTTQFNGTGPNLFKILWDTNIVSLTSTSFNTKGFVFNMKEGFENRVIYYDPTGGVLGSNHLYAMFASDTAGALGEAVFQSRITYRDE